MDNFGYVADSDDSEDEGMQVPEMGNLCLNLYQWGQKYVLFFIPYLILEMILSVQSRIATI